MGSIIRKSLFCSVFFISFFTGAEDVMSSDEAIIEPSMMVLEAWSQPDFISPEQAMREVASESEAPAVVSEHQPWQYLGVQSLIPHTEALSKSWYERKVLREIEQEDQAASSVQ